MVPNVLGAGPRGGGQASLAGSRPQHLAQAFDPRRNGLLLIRFGLAGIVAVAHALGVGCGHQPALGRTNLSDFAVDAFFVLSGFLVLRSNEVFSPGMSG